LEQFQILTRDHTLCRHRWVLFGVTFFSAEIDFTAELHCGTFTVEIFTAEESLTAETSLRSSTAEISLLSFNRHSPMEAEKGNFRGGAPQ
jgi:hypothetical protein